MTWLFETKHSGLRRLLLGKSVAVLLSEKVIYASLLVLVLLIALPAAALSN